MNDDELEQIRLHSAGATVRHNSPFTNLNSYQNENEINQEFRNNWVIPFYFNLNNTDNEWINNMVKLYPKITDEVILKNLGDFNWRTRSTGAFFTALKNKKEFIEIIGTHLLKSEVCYAGRTYAKTLAFFNEDHGNEYLEKYLKYYLKQKSLYFDQAAVLISIKYLDKINGTNKVENHLSDWKEYISDKPHFEENLGITEFESEIEVIKKIISIADKG